MNFKINTIPNHIVDQLRGGERSPQFNHPVFTEIASGYGPCRYCLKSFNEGIDERLLFTFDPFQMHDRPPLPGPVFIHKESCVRYSKENSFPEQLRFIPMTLNYFSKGDGLRQQVLPDDDDPTHVIERISEEDDPDFIIVRNQEEGCYLFTIELE